MNDEHEHCAVCERRYATATAAADAAAEAVGNMAEKLTTVMAERDRLQAQLHELMARDVDVVDLMNVEYGCPDCGVHHACGEIVAERDRLRAALTLIAIPPSNAMRHDHEFTACSGCAHVAQRALDGQDYRPNVAALDGSADATDG